KYSMVTPFGLEVTPEMSSVNTGLKLVCMSISKHRQHFNAQLRLKIMDVVRKNKGKEKLSIVANEKYCFLFVAELPIRDKIVKTWTTSFPLIVITHGCDSMNGWAAATWDNAFPAPNREGFEVRPTAYWCQLSEMLGSVFRMWVGAESSLKPSHLECIANKLKLCTGDAFPQISWKEMVKGENTNSDGSENSFWCWFYRAALIVKSYFKEVWENNYIEGFIGGEEACSFLLSRNAQPGTFIIRFSDSVPGSISLIVVLNDGTTCRWEPLEFYLQNKYGPYSESFLNLLGAEYSVIGGEIFRYVYPNICKKQAFANFYEKVPDRKVKLKEHYKKIVSVMKTDDEDKDMEDGSSRNQENVLKVLLNNATLNEDMPEPEESSDIRLDSWQNISTPEMVEWMEALAEAHDV
ncbi:Signal transducer and activator of transcription 5B, partial [Orchesella cincta]